MAVLKKKVTKENSSPELKKLDSIAFYIIIFIWTMAICFAVVSIFQPVWLQNISSPGRVVEAQTYIDKGNAELYGGNIPLAITNYLLAIEIDPENLNANGNLGVAYVELGEFDKAKEQFAKFVELEGAEHRLFMYYSNYGDLFEKTGEHQKAYEMYSKAVKLHPSPVYELRKAGYYAILTNNDSAAFHYLTRAMKEAKDFGSLYKEAAFNAYLDASAIDDKDKIEIINEILHNIGSEELENRYCSDIFHENNRFGVKLGYSNYYLGLYYQKQGNNYSANDYFDKAVYCFPALRQKVDEARKMN
jgi:Tfp pilus assembly protein PilF